MKTLQDKIHETAIRKSDTYIDSVVGSIDETDRLIHRTAFESGFSHGVNWYVRHRKGLGGAQEMLDTLKNVIAAWESLPEGHHSKEKIQKWILNDIYPVVTDIRVLITSIEKGETK